MSISSVERLLDVAVKNFQTADCSVLHYGPPNKEFEIVAGSARHKAYKDEGSVLRWYLGLMGDTSPVMSPLSVDVAGDKEYHVYRYDWVFGVSLPDVCGPDPGELWWNWQKALAKATPVAVQLIIQPGESGIGHTCVATSLNVLPPSRDTETWWQRNKRGVIDIVKAGAKTAEEIYPGMITKTFAALSNSLESRSKWRKPNWFIYQFLDSKTQACAVEWRINKKVLDQYGALLRGSLVMAFHGGAKDGANEHKGIRLILRPLLGFSAKDELSRVTPTFKLRQDQQVKLEIVPRTPQEANRVRS